MAGKQPNAVLHALFREAGFASYQDFASELNRFSRQDPLIRRGRTPPSATTSAVWQWMNGGRTPQDPAMRRRVAAVLSRRTGRRVTIDEIGWPDPEGQTRRLGLGYPASPRDAARVVQELLTAEFKERLRLIVQSAPLSAQAYRMATWSWLTQTPPAPPRPVRLDDAAVITSMTARFREMRAGAEKERRADERAEWPVGFAGRGASEKASATINNDAVRGGIQGYLASILREHHLDDQAAVPGPAILAAVAELTALLSECCDDAGQASPAQRYGIQALGLAGAAGDTALGGYLLAVFSRQILDAGEPECAREVARAGRLVIDEKTSPSVMAMLAVREARAHALLAATGTAGAAEHARSALANAERIRAVGPGPSDPGWLGDLTGRLFVAESAACLRDLAS